MSRLPNNVDDTTILPFRMESVREVVLHSEIVCMYCQNAVVFSKGNLANLTIKCRVGIRHNKGAIIPSRKMATKVKLLMTLEIRHVVIKHYGGYLLGNIFEVIVLTLL